MVAFAGARWSLAPCLVGLFRETDKLFPRRSTISDGTIGNAEHAARESDHNPDGNGWVDAADLTDDKSSGCDADHLAQHLIAAKDPRVSYIIWNRTIVRGYDRKATSTRPFLKAWTPEPYTGTNPHDKHTHISVADHARGYIGPWWPQEDDMPLTDADLLKIADVVAIRMAPELKALADDVKRHEDTLRDGLAAVTRRTLGVDLMADGSEQHKADADTGSRFQKLLDGAD